MSYCDNSESSLWFSYTCGVIIGVCFVSDKSDEVRSVHLWVFNKISDGFFLCLLSFLVNFLVFLTHFISEGFVNTSKNLSSVQEPIFVGVEIFEDVIGNFFWVTCTIVWVFITSVIVLVIFVVVVVLSFAVVVAISVVVFLLVLFVIFILFIFSSIDTNIASIPCSSEFVFAE